MSKSRVIGSVAVIVVIAALVSAFFVIKQKDEQPAKTTTDTSQQKSETLKNNSGEGSDAPAVKDGVTATQAGNIAIQQYGGTVKGVAPDNYNGEPTWNVEITGSPQGDIAVVVGQSSGDVLTTEKQADK